MAKITQDWHIKDNLWWIALLTFSRQLDRLEFNSVIYLIHRASLQQTAVSVVKISMDSITSWLPLRLKETEVQEQEAIAP